MTESERQQILKMIEAGKITAAEGLTLMQALDNEPEAEGSDGAELPDLLTEAEEPQSERKTDPEFQRRVNRFRSLWLIPLTFGVAVTVAGAYWMYMALEASGFGFWFYCAGLPFLLGVLVTALAFSSRTSRWIYVNVKQKPGETPQRIVIAFPLSVVSWLLQFAKGSISVRDRGAVDEVMGAVMQSTHSDEPLMVDVEEEDGEHVQVYIG